MAAVVAVGVDAGGTWIRIKGFRANGQCAWSLKKPAPSVDKLSDCLKKHLGRFHGQLPILAVGSRGLWALPKRQAVQRALQGLAQKIIVISDVEAAWASAFKTEGILIISGTGSIGYGRRSDGIFARAGGLGPEKGDEGSGYWIGKEWRRRQSFFGGKSTVREIAALSPTVMRKAQAGHPMAAQIIREAQQHLAELVVTLRKELSLKGSLPLSVSGSVLEHEWFQHGFFRTLRAKKVRFRFRPKTIDQTFASLIAKDIHDI